MMWIGRKKTGWFHATALAVFGAWVGLGCGSTSSEEPLGIVEDVASAPAVALGLNTPGGVHEYAPFVLVVRAMAETGATADDYKGTVEIKSSAGALHPSTVSLEQGVGEVQIVVNRPGNISLSVNAGDLVGTAPLTVWPAEWARSSGDAVLKGDSFSDGHWTYGGILSPSVVRGENGELWMYFSTTGGGSPDAQRLDHVLGRAFSSDEGASWSFVPDEPLWTPGAAGGFGIGAPSVLRDDGGGWHLWFGELGESEYMEIGYATSSDGENWERESCLALTLPDVPYWGNLGVDDPGAVMDENGQIRLFFTAHGPSVSSRVIGTARGDCENGWTEFAIVISVGEAGTWSAGGVYAPMVWREELVWKMFYAGIASPTAKPTLGYAYSDEGDSWTSVDDNPLMIKLGVWDVHGLDQPAVAPGAEETPTLFFNGWPTDQRPRVGRAIPNG